MRWLASSDSSSSGSASPVRRSDASIGLPEEIGADSLEEKVRDPNDQFWMILWFRVEALGDDEKRVIDGKEDQGQRDTNGGFSPMGLNAERDSNQGKTETGERKGDLSVNL